MKKVRLHCGKVFVTTVSLTCLSILSLLAASNNETTEHLYEASDTLSNAREVRISVKVSLFHQERFPYRDVLWWGAESHPPETYIEYVSITVDDKKSWVRLSSHCDLANVRTVDLRVSTVGFHLEIDGGETSTHYKALISFDNDGFLQRRRVFRPSFPDEVWEATEYSFIRREGM